MDAFGNTVRDLRKARSMTQEDLAEKSGLHPNYIGGIERGSRNPCALNILALARALSVAPAELWRDYNATDMKRLPKKKQRASTREK